VGHLSCCGIVVSWLLKYADAIAKAYATSGAIFLSSAYSVIALGVALPTRLLAAMILASFSLLMFYGGIRVSFGGKTRCVENLRTSKSLQMLRTCNQEQV
jgi:UDP-sugar transporter A1/2/3